MSLILNGSEAWVGLSRKGMPGRDGRLWSRSLGQVGGNARRTAVLSAGSIPAGVIVATAHVWRNGRRATLRWWCPSGRPGSSPGMCTSHVGGRLAPNADWSSAWGLRSPRLGKRGRDAGTGSRRTTQVSPAQGKVRVMLRRGSSEVEHRAHNPECTGSIPVPVTCRVKRDIGPRAGGL